VHGHPLVRSTYNSFLPLDPFDRSLQSQVMVPLLGFISCFRIQGRGSPIATDGGHWPARSSLDEDKIDRSIDRSIYRCTWHTADVSLYRCRTDTGLRRFVAVTVIILYESYTSEIHGGTCFEHCRWVFSERWLHCMCIASAYS
jgi:hypothetical protein